MINFIGPKQLYIHFLSFYSFVYVNFNSDIKNTSLKVCEKNQCFCIFYLL